MTALERLLKEWEPEGAIVLMWMILYTVASPYDNVRFTVLTTE